MTLINENQDPEGLNLSNSGISVDEKSDAITGKEIAKNLNRKRYFKNSSEVRAITEDLIHYFLQVGSLNKVAELLSESIGETIRPNRIAPILGSDNQRAINLSTLEMIIKAISQTEKGEKKFEDSFRKELINANASLNNHELPYEAKIAQLATKVRIPFEVANWFAHSLGIEKGLFEGNNSQSFLHSSLRVEPDWSFQDDAYEACRKYLSSDIANKWGLIVPTGGGKTRIAIRVGLGILKDSQNENSIIVWITHRRTLQEQAHQEFLRALNDKSNGLTREDVKLYRSRFKILMVQDTNLKHFLETNEENIELLIVDEAHHAAVNNVLYQPVNDMSSIPGLWLTATPNRTDLEPIGIEGVAYEITYAELFERGVILKPIFENDNVPYVKWDQEEDILELAEYLLSRSFENDFIKILVVATQLEHVEKLYDVLQNEIKNWEDHPINSDSIGYVHGGGNSGLDSYVVSNNEFLSNNKDLPRGILISTNSYIGEGFDDPSINTVVITYETSSIVYLMQAAGRALRSAPGKDNAFIVQVRESDVQYYFYEEWLYQDISDFLKPKVVMAKYSDLADLRAQVTRILDERNVETGRDEILQKCMEVEHNGRFKLMLSGRKYTGTPEDFDLSSKWRAKAFSADDIRIFNAFCILNDRIPDRNDWLNLHGIKENDRDSWLDLLYACRKAKDEISLPKAAKKSSDRNFDMATGTTWLTYITFQFFPNINTEVETFFDDCVNKSAILEEYSNKSETFSLAIKIPHPLAGSIGFLFKEKEQIIFEKYCDELTQNLRENDLTKSYEIMESWRLSLENPTLPNLVLHRIENFLGKDKDTKMLNLKEVLSN